MRIKAALPLFALCLLALCLLGPVPVRAQDERDTYVRMYTEDNKLVAPPPSGDGVVPAHRSVSNSSDMPPAAMNPDAAPAAPAPASSTPVPTRANAVPPPPGQHRAVMTSGTSGGSLTKVESFGTLTDAKSGGLGTDMWDGSSRAAVTGLIQSLPDTASFRIASQLTRRALLTAADTDLLDANDTPAPGQDLLTLRIRKLMAMGALDEAAALYKENPLPPHDAAMAEAGIAALLADAQPALACLETKALDSRFSNDENWAPLGAFCSSYIGRLSGHGETASGGGDNILRQMTGSASYRFHATDLHDLDHLAALDRVMLAADHRVEYGAASGAASLSPLTLALVVHDTSAPLTLRFNLMIAGARTGIFDKDDIANFYKAIPFTNLAQTDAQVAAGKEAGWQRVAWLYKSGDTQHGLIDKSVLQAALPLRGAYGDIALWPFAPLLQTVDPAGFGTDAVHGAVTIALQSGDSIPENWAASWKNNEVASSGIRVAFALGTNGILDNSPIENSGLSEEATQLLTIAIKQLDNGKKLHKINEADIYGNVNAAPALAGLEAAEKDHRLGEAVLLASAALNRQSPATLSPAVFREVLSGYRLIGLNKEARALAIEVALGIK